MRALFQLLPTSYYWTVADVHIISFTTPCSICSRSGIPFEMEWGSSGLRGAAAAYIALVIRLADVDSAVTLAALRRRWEGLYTGASDVSDNGQSMDGLTSQRKNAGDTGSSGAGACGVFPPSREAVIAPRAAELARRFAAVPHGARETYVGNFAEHLAARVLDDPNNLESGVVSQDVPRFLRACVWTEV
jgi:hypothetical protein